MRLKLISLFLFPLSMFAANVTNVSVGTTICIGTNISNVASGGGGGASWTVLGSVFGNGNGSTTTTSSATDTTGAKLIIAQVEGSGFVAWSDSKANSWTMLSDPTGTPRSAYYYCISPTVGSGHTFSATLGASFTVIYVNKSSGTPAFDLEASGTSGNFWVNQSSSPGSITPTTSADIMFTSIIYDTYNNTNGTTVNAGYTVLLGGHATSGRNLVAAYQIKSDSAAVNPTWASTNDVTGAGSSSIHAAFK